MTAQFQPNGGGLLEQFTRGLVAAVYDRCRELDGIETELYLDADIVIGILRGVDPAGARPHRFDELSEVSSAMFCAKLLGSFRLLKPHLFELRNFVAGELANPDGASTTASSVRIQQFLQSRGSTVDALEGLDDTDWIDAIAALGADALVATTLVGPTSSARLALLIKDGTLVTESDRTDLTDLLDDPMLDPFLQKVNESRSAKAGSIQNFNDAAACVLLAQRLRGEARQASAQRSVRFLSSTPALRAVFKDSRLAPLLSQPPTDRDRWLTPEGRFERPALRTRTYMVLRGCFDSLQRRPKGQHRTVAEEKEFERLSKAAEHLARLAIEGNQTIEAAIEGIGPVGDEALVHLLQRGQNAGIARAALDFFSTRSRYRGLPEELHRVFTADSIGRSQKRIRHELGQFVTSVSDRVRDTQVISDMLLRLIGAAKRKHQVLDRLSTETEQGKLEQDAGLFRWPLSIEMAEEFRLRDLCGRLSRASRQPTEATRAALDVILSATGTRDRPGERAPFEFVVLWLLDLYDDVVSCIERRCNDVEQGPPELLAVWLTAWVRCQRFLLFDARDVGSRLQQAAARLKEHRFDRLELGGRAHLSIAYAYFFAWEREGRLQLPDAKGKPVREDWLERSLKAAEDARLIFLEARSERGVVAAVNHLAYVSHVGEVPDRGAAALTQLRAFRQSPHLWNELFEDTDVYCQFRHVLREWQAANKGRDTERTRRAAVALQPVLEALQERFQHDPLRHPVHEEITGHLREIQATLAQVRQAAQVPT